MCSKTLRLEFGTSSMMFHAMENESGNTSEEEINNLFDPKIFIESLFKTRDAEIELILNTTTTTTTTANFTKLLNSDTTNNDKDIDHQNADHLDYTLDVYLLIGAVSFVIFVILSVAMCKAITMLKISLQDGADDTVPVPAEQLQNQQRAMGPEMVTQSVASGYLLNGIRQFSATLRSRISLKSEDDLPPPYDEEAFGTTTNQDNENEEASPPPYHVAITMTSENATQPQVLSDEEVVEDEDDDEQEISADETDSKVNFAAKKVRTPKLPKISS